ncbi:exosortase-associated protein EpsI, B-type [Rubrivivax albus]|uniref:EpsI family protein n=1 Tax=Rubrivivax albus TaxID=2499835 RepID=A0A437JZY0_9BURK|nr:exosortase-associated protein EpsI, B-type [Rubrivivax albus]RVT53668.1 EpsI family protein [Rubrivivax albus]
MNTSLKRRGFVAAAMMFGGAGLAVAMRPTRHMADEIGMPDLEQIFPKQFGDWQVDTNTPIILPSPDVQALLDKIYNQVLARTYVNRQGQRIMLSVAYGGDQSDGTSAHRPEVCYPAQGFVITTNRLATVPLPQKGLPVRQLMSKLGQRSEPITYWVVVGGDVVTTGIGQKLAQMRYGVRGVIADGMLVRVSSIDPDMAKGHALQARFVLDLASQMAPAAAERVFGSSRA